MEIIIYQVDAFADKPFGGNPAGVVPDASELSDKDMQNIAREMNLSETAFVIPKAEGKFIVRFFTTEQEVDLCGHATIGAFYTLSHKGYIKPLEKGIKRVYQETKVGELPVDIYFEDSKVTRIMMYQDSPKYLGKYENLEALTKGLNILEKDLGLNKNKSFPEILSTGLPDIIVPLQSKEILDNLNINKDLISHISKESKVAGIHAFTIENEKIYARNFAPALGIDEESATGTANGALLAYLIKNNIINSNKITVYQGESLNRPSIINCEMIREDNETKIKVGGNAVLVLEGVINI